MDATAPPRLIEHPRTADGIAAALERLLEPDFGPAHADPLRTALVQIAARYAETVTERINAAPEQHLRAFADLLGVRPRSAAAARVVLNFRPTAAPAGGRVVVPRHTRVCAAPAAGETEPVVYETLDDLELVRAELARSVAVDAGHRHAGEPGATTAPAPVPRALHIAQAVVFGTPGLRQVRLEIRVQEAAADGTLPGTPAIECAVATPAGAVTLPIVSDTTAGLSRSGELLLEAPPAWPVGSVDGVASRWLTLRPAPPEGGARPPRLVALAVHGVAVTAAQPLAAACHDGMPLDLSKDAFAFGEQPRFGSVFQATSPVFAEAGTRVDLRLALTNPVGAGDHPIASVSREGSPVVAWEISTARGFRPVDGSDGTRSLTQDGVLAFTVPDDAAPVAIAGRSGVWLRARLASGDYGRIASAEFPAITTPRAPAIRSASVEARLARGPLAPDHLVSQGALACRHLDPALPAPVDAFVAPDVHAPVLYLGLQAAPEALAGGRTLCWQVSPARAEPPLAVGAAPAAAEAMPRWQVRGPGGWLDAAVRDTTRGLRDPGIVTVTLPAPPSPWAGSTLDPGRALAWLRIVFPEAPGGATRLPVALTLNAVAAQQSQRLRDEVVGSSNGRASQAFRALRTPVIGPVELQVREAGDGWTPWLEVDDLAACGADARAHTVDRSTGELRFGDGRFGRIPPPGANNIRLHVYATGGGRRGNRPALAVAQLMGAIPGVAAVGNVEPAAGGLDADDATAVREQGSAWLRHRDRAVCADDHADLARRASPEVARAFCVAGRDLAAATVPAAGDAEAQAGVVSVVVIPQGPGAAPQPGLPLLATVKAHLDARRAPVGRLVVVGPTYAPVAVQLRITAGPGVSPHEVAAECTRRVERFLHPIDGGADGRGWALGQRPHRSDLQRLLGAVDGVAEVHALRLQVGALARSPFAVAAAGLVEVAVS